MFGFRAPLFIMPTVPVAPTLAMFLLKLEDELLPIAPPAVPVLVAVFDPPPAVLWLAWLDVPLIGREKKFCFCTAACASAAAMLR